MIKSNLKKQYIALKAEFVQHFEKKHGYELTEFLGDDYFGFIDQYYFSTSEIIYDIMNDCKKKEIFRWQDYAIEKSMTSDLPCDLSFKDWLKGKR